MKSVLVFASKSREEKQFNRKNIENQKKKK